MNMIKRELKAGLKPFIFWTLGLAVLMFAGVMKFTGAETGGAGLEELFKSIPKIVQAVFGMVGVDIMTFGGYYAVLAQYGLIITALYAVFLGNGAVSRESVDQTYEFVFTKPRTRSNILLHKLAVNGIYLVVYCVLSFLFSLSAATTLHLKEDVSGTIALYSVDALLVGLVFFGISAMFAASLEHTEHGARAGNILVLVTFAVGVVYDMMDHGEAVRFFTPFKYFIPTEMLENNLNPLFSVLCVVLSAAALVIAFRAFEKRDLKAV